jgi:hypothetical protein
LLINDDPVPPPLLIMILTALVDVSNQKIAPPLFVAIEFEC